jgi:hypothetical protein
MASAGKKDDVNTSFMQVGSCKVSDGDEVVIDKQDGSTSPEGLLRTVSLLQQ